MQGHVVDMPAGEARFSAGVAFADELLLLHLRSVADGGFVQRQPDGLPGRTTRRARPRSTRSTARCCCRCSRDKPGVRAPEPRARLSLLRLRVAGRRRYVQGPDRLGHHRDAALPRRPPARDARAEHRGDVPGRHAELVRLGRRATRAASTAMRLRRQRGREPELPASVRHLARRAWARSRREFYGPGTCSRTATSGRRSSTRRATRTSTRKTPKPGPRASFGRPNTGREQLGRAQPQRRLVRHRDHEHDLRGAGAQRVYEQCLSVGSTRRAIRFNPACRAINRNPVNGVAAPTTTVSYVNAAFARTSRRRRRRGLAHGPRGRQLRRELHGLDVAGARRRRPRPVRP